MSRAGDDDRLGSTSDDDLIEVQVTRASSTASSRGRNAFDNLLNPRGVASRARPVTETLSLPMPPGFRPAGVHSRRSHQPAGSPQPSQIRLRPSHHPQATLRRSWGRTPVPDSAFIDLTEEPDSPAAERRRPQVAQAQAQAAQQPLQQQPHNLAGRNPRRTGSQRTSPPQLARSDSTFVGPQPSFIDLTADSPEDEQLPGRDHWRLSRSHPRQHRRHHHHHHHHGHDHDHDHDLDLDHDHLAQHRDRLVSLDLISHHQQALASEFARGFGRTLAGFLNGEIVRGSFGPELQTMFPRSEPTPKPPMEPIPPARTGFSRDTCADGQGERVVICPACNEELAYDPAEPPATPSKKRKKASGEHHFWALKKCGHVYCAECFENRRPTKSSPDGVGFPLPPGSKSTASPNDIRCAVEGCDTKVAAKTEWVGIFL
ncbi:hypothetical protein Trco_008431 [Trichoderma cornu-damae]|uniref:Uncharacterized protein n=1 Tax=Trichoderma cornu-damae TaxID=654480 RepID=A0A9P8QE18_9HYPO|nr:hypothetical protein Trco_008431 [Trichoderma cornu-damae]